MVVDPRPQFKLKSEFVFKDPNGLVWNVPSGEVVDGASIPQVFWSFIGGPFDGKYINASVIHDHYCRVKSRTAHDTHRNFYYGMRAVGLPDWQSKLMHWAVASFGPDWKLEKRIVQEVKCTVSNGRTTCATMAVPKLTVVEVSAVDLENPEVRAIALSKFSSIAKTLKTSSGQTLDVSRYGQIDATAQSIEANAEGFRELLSTRAYKTNSADLGLLADMETVPLEQVSTWPNSQIPDFPHCTYAQRPCPRGQRGSVQSSGYRSRSSGKEGQPHVSHIQRASQFRGEALVVASFPSQPVRHELIWVEIPQAPARGWRASHGERERSISADRSAGQAPGCLSGWPGSFGLKSRARAA